jgi:hypothetical protein
MRQSPGQSRERSHSVRKDKIRWLARAAAFGYEEEINRRPFH